MIRFTLIRHTSVAVDTGICYGQSDVELADSFFTEANNVRSRLDGNSFDAVYSSPLSRCVKLARHCGFDQFISDERLLELNFGDWELLPWANIDDPQLDKWFANWVDESPTHGESFRLMIERVADFVNMIQSSQYNNILIFCHAGVIRIFHHLLNNAALPNLFELAVPYGDIQCFELS